MEFVHPSTLLVAGPTQCGKTFFIKRVLDEKLFSPWPTRVIWAYGEWQDTYEKIRAKTPNIEFVHGLDKNLYDSIKPEQDNLLVIDDLMKEAGASEILAHLFTRGSHHRNLSVIYIVQKLYDKGKSHRSCSLNSHYIVLFKNPRDNSQADVLGRQMFPSKKNFVSSALEDVSKEERGYLVFDLRPETSDDFRVRSKIFRNEPHVVYKPLTRTI